jgi:hypothetical protein
MQKYLYSYFFGGRVVWAPQTFLTNRNPKLRESLQWFFGLRLVSRIFEEFQHPPIQAKKVQSFGGFFIK